MRLEFKCSSISRNWQVTGKPIASLNLPITPSKVNVTFRFHRVLGKRTVTSTSFAQMVFGWENLGKF